MLTVAAIPLLTMYLVLVRQLRALRYNDVQCLEVECLGLPCFEVLAHGGVVDKDTKDERLKGVSGVRL